MNKKLIMAFICCWLGGIFAGSNASIFSIVLPQAIGELTGSAGREVISSSGSIILFSFLIGWMFGGIFGGHCSDRYGRVKTMCLGIALYSLFTALAAVTQSVPQLALCRFLAGVGIGAEMLSISVYLSEVWPEKGRAMALGAAITSYQVGVFLSGIIGLHVSNWRDALALGGTPLLLALAVYLMLPESSQWKQIGPAAPFFSQIKHHQVERQLLLGIIGFGGLLVGYWGSVSWVPTWIQDLGGEAHKSSAVMIHGVCAVLGCLAAGPLVNAFGRLKVLILSLFAAFAASLWMFSCNHEFAPVIYAQYGFIGAAVGVLQAGYYIYLPELFPTQIRGACVGSCLNAGRLITAAAVLCMGPIVALLGGYGSALILASMAYLVGLTACLFGKETN